MALLRCPACGAEEAASSLRAECACGEPFDVEHAFRPVSRELFDARTRIRSGPEASGVWRFREIVYPRLPTEAIVSLREGNTPLLRSPGASACAGVDDLAFAHEGLNPTGSFKDRGMTVAVSRAVASGARRILCASTGNTAASAAAYAAAAGLECAVLAPEGRTSLAKLAQAAAYGAHVILVRAGFDRAMELARELAAAGEAHLVNSLDPFRLEGQKSIPLELLQSLAWQAPDWIAFPAGNLGNCSAFGKALREARYLGLVDRTPRLLAVQAAGAAPFARAFERGFAERISVEPETAASAIRIGAPVSWNRAVRALRETKGAAIAVEDAELFEAKQVIDRAGIGCELASAASLAGVRRMVASGAISPHASVVCVLTGHLLKEDASAVGRAAGTVVDADLASLRRALG